jgi:hypothetical protein
VIEILFNCIKSRLLIALEAVPTLFHCKLSDLVDPEISTQLESIPLEGNLLDLVAFGDILLISVDNIHSPGTKDVSGPQVCSPLICDAH